MYRTIYQPTLLYGLDAIPLNHDMSNKLENCQGGIMKRVCGIAKRSHHSQLLRALHITGVDDVLLKSAFLLLKVH